MDASLSSAGDTPCLPPLAPKHLSALQARFDAAIDALPLTGPVLLDFTDPALPSPIAARLKAALDLDRLASWKGLGTQDGGNCFFAATHAGVMLLGAGIPGFRLVTGRFGPHPEDKETIEHAWIEFIARNRGFILNLSNLARRPGYILDRQSYLAMNRCTLIHQAIEGRILAARARSAGLDPVRHLDHGGRLRRFTRTVLAQSLRKAF